MVHEIIISNPLSGIIPSKYPKQPRFLSIANNFFPILWLSSPDDGKVFLWLMTFSPGFFRAEGLGYD